MMCRNLFTVFFLLAVLAITSSAFTIPTQKTSRPGGADLIRLDVSSNSNVMASARNIMTVASVAIMTSPLAVIAEEVDDYEYGAVNAPIGLAWGVGVLAIATALLPVVLRQGEDAFEEMKERDADKWGTGKTYDLDKRKR